MKDGSVSPVGGLIGIMVEEEEDIAKLDIKAILAESSGSAPAEAPKEEAQAPV